MSAPDKARDGREARLAEALRANLRKRKTQARIRSEAAHEAEPADAAGETRQAVGPVRAASDAGAAEDE